MTRVEVLEALRTYLADYFKTTPASISEATRFSEDLAADSFDLVALLIELEESYGLIITDKEAVKLRTVGQATDFLVARLDASRQPPAPTS